MQNSLLSAVNVCRCKTRFVGGHYILYVKVCVTVHGQFAPYGRYNSFLGHNAMFCYSKFNVNVIDIGSCAVNVRRAVDQYV